MPYGVIRPQWVNPSYTGFILGKIDTYIHQEGDGSLSLFLWKTKTWCVPWLLMTWWCEEPGHQQLWCWVSYSWIIHFQHQQIKPWPINIWKRMGSYSTLWILMWNITIFLVNRDKYYTVNFFQLCEAGKWRARDHDEGVGIQTGWWGRRRYLLHEHPHHSGTPKSHAWRSWHHFTNWFHVRHLDVPCCDLWLRHQNSFIVR